MNHYKKALIILIALIQASSLILISTDSAFLQKSIIGGYQLNWQSLLAWLLFTLFPLNFLLIRRQGTIPKFPRLVYRSLVTTGALFGLLWLFVSYLLAGNWSFQFEDNIQYEIWQAYTYVTPLLPFVGYFLMRIILIFYPNKRMQ